MSSLRFSVIIPTLNEEKFLPNLLDSLVNQTEKPFEVIVVDGKSKDETAVVAQSFQKKLPLRMIACERANVSVQRNLGAKEARAGWLVFVDADSVLLPYFFARVMAFLQDREVVLCTTWCKPDSDTPTDALLALLANMTIEGSRVVKRPFFSPGPLTVVSRQTWKTVGGYDETIQWGEDIDLSRRVVEWGFPCGVHKETLYIWSLRRFREQGTLRVAQLYAKGLLALFLTKRPPKTVAGYVMGGQLYGKKKK